MKRSSIYLFFAVLLSTVFMLFLVTLAGCSGDGIVLPENQIRSLSKAEQQISSHAFDFGIDLINKINESEKEQNIFISPLSVSTAFGMVLNGSNGNTYEEIKSTLGLEGLTLTEINNSYKGLNELLPGIDNTTTFTSANSIWYRNTFSVENNFINTNKNYFNAVVNAADFSDPGTPAIINNWVKESTNNKIDKIVERIDDHIVMYVINAIYFKGTWKYQFDKSKTIDDKFYALGTDGVTVKMMTQENEFRFKQENNFKAIELPYGNESFRMLILMPGAETSLENVLQNFNKNKFESLTEGMQKLKTVLMLPKFKVEYEKNLNETLKAMGIKDAFIPGAADLTGINKNSDLYIDNVKHKTFVEIDEEGTEAAAVTSVEVGVTSIGENSIIKIDRPFIFFIYEKNTNTVLFIGKIVNPSI